MGRSVAVSKDKLKQDIDPAAFRAAILKWYTRHQRALPWRAVKGQKPDPYHVWLSEIMLQQTTVPAVIPYFLKFAEKWPGVEDLAAADQQDVLNEWAGLGYYARARNLHKCAQAIVKEHDGHFPDCENALLKLPGVGPYTAAAISAIAFNNPANVVDGNVERVMSRIFKVEKALPDCKPDLKSFAGLLADGEERRPGDYAQSLMDLGAGICTPKSPKCLLCPASDFCGAFAVGDPERYPVRKAKQAKPVRHGNVYFIQNSKDEFLLERRAEKGLLGGMTGFPTTSWEPSQKTQHLSYIRGDIKKMRGVQVRHIFTHFELRLNAYEVRYSGRKIPENHYWQNGSDFDPEILPGLFRKFYKALR